MSKIGLALGSGGARGIAHIAFIKVFEELNIKPAGLSGTSMGALIGALYTSGYKSSDLVESLKVFKKHSNYLSFLDFSIFKTSFLKGEALEKYIKKLLPFKNFEDLSIPLKISTCDFWGKKEYIIESGDLLSAIRASLSIPTIFKPVLKDGRILVDGGVVNPVPYDLLKKSCDFIVAVDVAGFREYENKTQMPKFFETFMNTYDILQESVLNAKLKISKPDVLIKANLKDIEFLDFNKYQNILDSVDADAIYLKNKLLEFFGNSKKSFFHKILKACFKKTE